MYKFGILLIITGALVLFGEIVAFEFEFVTRLALSTTACVVAFAGGIMVGYKYSNHRTTGKWNKIQTIMTKKMKVA